VPPFPNVLFHNKSRKKPRKLSGTEEPRFSRRTAIKTGFDGNSIIDVSINQCILFNCTINYSTARRQRQVHYLYKGSCQVDNRKHKVDIQRLRRLQVLDGEHEYNLTRDHHSEQHASRLCSYALTQTHTHNHFTTLLNYIQDNPGEPAPERY